MPIDLIKDLTDAQRQALEEGADLGQVVNAYRGVSPAARKRMTYTSEGMTRHRLAYKRARERGNTKERMVRPTPDGIYRYADSREEAIDLLYRYGYLN